MVTQQKRETLDGLGLDDRMLGERWDSGDSGVARVDSWQERLSILRREVGAVARRIRWAWWGGATTGFVAAVTCLPATAAAQHHPDLVRATLTRFVAENQPAASPVLCVTVKPAHSEGERDATPDEVPEQLHRDGEVVRGSECERHRTGALHARTGRKALLVRIGLQGVPATGRAEVTFGWFRSGKNAGAMKCAASRSGDEWVLDRCAVLWQS